jgi:hypothetical protein
MEAPRLDDFPKYKDGDVSIVISSTRVYQLHSTILKRNSPYFERELQSPGARLTSKARQEGLAAYRFELVTQGPHEIGYFERKVGYSLSHLFSTNKQLSIHCPIPTSLSHTGSHRLRARPTFHVRPP